jgi:hypothetical protein
MVLTLWAGATPVFQFDRLRTGWRRKIDDLCQPIFSKANEQGKQSKIAAHADKKSFHRRFLRKGRFGDNGALTISLVLAASQPVVKARENLPGLRCPKVRETSLI